jgi:SRSO17 transposase
MEQLPILEIPQDISRLCTAYEPAFSRPQYKQFERFITSLMVSSDADIAALASGHRLSQSYDSLHHFVSESPWEINDVLEHTVSVLKHLPNDRGLHENGMLIIDDTLIEKYGKFMEATGKLWDHSQGRFLNYAHCLVGLCWADHKKLRYPLRFEIYQKEDWCKEHTVEFKTKIEIAIALVEWAVVQGIPFQTVVFDSWFFTKDFCDYIEELGRDWISMSKSDRIVTIKGEKQAVSKYAENLEPTKLQTHKLKDRTYAVQSVQGRFQCLKRGKETVRLIVSYEEKAKEKGGGYKSPVYLVTNRKDIRPERLLRAYQVRWNIETFFKDAKSNLGLGEYQMRRLNGIKSHWCLVFTSAIVLELVRWEVCTKEGLAVSKMTFGDLKRRAWGQTMRAIIRRVTAYARNGLSDEQIYAILQV